MNLIATLLIGHLIADFPLQTDWIYRYKTESWVGILLHVIIHLFVTALLIQPLSTAIPLLLLLGILHFITDYMKVRLSPKRQATGFLIDQFVHIMVLCLLAYGWQGSIVGTLPAALLVPLLLYGTFLGLMVFGWVLACDLAAENCGQYPVVQWARTNLLILSQYAGLSLFIFLAHFLRGHGEPSSYNQ